MKKTIKLSRAGFPGIGQFSWINFFKEVLSLKYNVVIDSENPDIVFYTNLHYNENEFDHYIGTKIKGIHDYNNSVKKIFISGEVVRDYIDYVNLGENYYSIGYQHHNHERYLRFPTYILDTYTLHNEGGMFDTPFGWITEKKNYDEIIKDKKHFCSIVQASFNETRDKIFDVIESKYYVKSSGPYRPTITEKEDLNKMKYHDYSNKNYLGKIDGLTYRDKIYFFKDTIFNIAVQLTNTDHLTQEKIIHAYAANCIPIFYGNTFILDEGFNPESFVNVHDYNDFGHLFEDLDEIYQNKNKLKSYLESPIFVDNKLPIYFDFDYILNFFDKILK
jgi:hypothetical protein